MAQQKCTDEEPELIERGTGRPTKCHFVTPTVVGAAEYDFAERDLRYTRAMFELLTADKEFADHNKAIMQDWLSDWTTRAIEAARTMQPLSSISSPRAVVVSPSNAGAIN